MNYSQTIWRSILSLMLLLSHIRQGHVKKELMSLQRSKVLGRSLSVSQVVTRNHLQHNTYHQAVYFQICSKKLSRRSIVLIIILLSQFLWLAYFFVLSLRKAKPIELAASVCGWRVDKEMKRSSVGSMQPLYFSKKLYHSVKSELQSLFNFIWCEVLCWPLIRPFSLRRKRLGFTTLHAKLRLKCLQSVFFHRV